VKETKFISPHSLQIDGSVKPSDRIDFYHEGHEEHEGGFAAKATIALLFIIVSFVIFVVHKAFFHRDSKRSH